MPSFLELILTQPTKSFTTFTKAKTYRRTFDVAVTTTDESAQLSIADGEVASGSKLGHLTSGSKRLPLPLEAARRQVGVPAARQRRWIRC